MIAQVVIRDNKNGFICGGIRLDNGNVICGHCGKLINKSNIGDNKDFTVLEGFESWIDLTSLICQGSGYC